MAEDDVLDAYSRVVAGVARELTPRVASLRVPRGIGRGSGPGEALGSAVVYTGDGFLLTNAHVVGRASGGTADFSDGTAVPFRVVGYRSAVRSSGGARVGRRSGAGPTRGSR